jgi:MoaD family protein
MAVLVKLYANFKEACGKDSVQVEGVKDVAALIDKLVKMCGKKLADELYYPDGKRMVETVQILVNGRGVKIPGGLGTPLKSEDIVAIFPPVAGG